LAEFLVKQLTGQDTVCARFLFGEYFDFTPQFKIFLATNHKVVIKDQSKALWRRIKFVSFQVEIPEEQQDRQLPEKLKREGPGILNWLLNGCLSWQQGGLATPDEVLDDIAKYKEEMDVVGAFLAECCVLAPGASAPAKGLYETYVEWAKNSGEKWPLTQRAFGMSLTERGFERDKGKGNKGIRRGLGLRE
jgi:putative DNA primase/helicase